MKPYSFYAFVAFQRYFRGNVGTNDVWKKNFEAARTVIQSIKDEKTLLILQDVYSCNEERIRQAVGNTAKKHGVDQRVVWEAMMKAEGQFAEIRGL